MPHFIESTAVIPHFIQLCPWKGQKVPLRLLRVRKFSKDSMRPCRQILFPSSCRYQMVIYSCFTPAEPKDADYERGSNKRPFSLLSIVSKVCERVVCNQFSSYVTSDGRLSNNQSGNKKLYSTETSVIETTDMILQAMDNKKLTAMVLLDMSKAFDSVDHKLMISKLQDAGASSSCIEWFRSYLSGRQ